MKNIKEKQFLVNMALALGQTPDPALMKEIDEHNKLMESITVKGDEFGSFLAQLAQLKDEVETVKQVVEVKQQYFESKEYPKPPTLEELMATVPEEVFEPKSEYAPDVREEPVQEELEKPVAEEKENISPLIAAASSHITKEVQMEANSFQQPEPTDPILRSVEDLKKKIKFLEGWISKIAMTGPGSGEVNLLKLDDVDTSDLGNGKFLRYNAANAKIEFATVTASGGSANLLSVSTAIVPDADSVYDIGTANLRWGTLFLANNTINLGGSLISSDGTGIITISSTGAVLPVNSKVAVDGIDKNIALVGNTGAIATVVPFFTKELGLNTIATNFTFGANPDDFVFTNFTFTNGSPITQSSRALFFF